MASLDNDTLLDVEELKSLMNVAQRPRVKTLLQAEINRLTLKLNTAAAPVPVPKPVATAPASASTDPNLAKPLTNYMWNQQDNVVSVFLPLAGIGSHPKENIEVNFEKQSVTLHIKNFQGSDHRFSVKKLHKPINPSASTFKVTPTKIVLNMKMAEQSFWTALDFKEDKKVKKPNMEDPTSGLMNMMKNLYEEGDDEMKRMIAKTWTESQQKKQEEKDPLSS